MAGLGHGARHVDERRTDVLRDLLDVLGCRDDWCGKREHHDTERHDEGKRR